MSISVENFLKQVYQIKYDDNEKVLSSRLADKLNVSNAAITDMARKLANQDFLIYKKYKEIELTSKGKIRALKVIRRHRLWESFLFKVLKLNDEEVHEEAELLEHQTSDFLLAKIDEYLNYPQFDPHGDPIPDHIGNLPENQTILLYKAQIDSSYKIARINNRDAQVSILLRQFPLKMNSILSVQKIFDDDSAIVITNNQSLHLSRELTGCIYLIKEKNKI